MFDYFTDWSTAWNKNFSNPFAEIQNINIKFSEDLIRKSIEASSSACSNFLKFTQAMNTKNPEKIFNSQMDYISDSTEAFFNYSAAYLDIAEKFCKEYQKILRQQAKTACAAAPKVSEDAEH